jgi:predicted PolB exonuclease-like 3'-5' exonuclease
MLNTINLSNILVVDIETVPQQKSFSSLQENIKSLWDEKTRTQRKEDQTANDFYDRAGIFAEFGKIICISFGIFSIQNKQQTIRIKSFYGDDEAMILQNFIDLIEKDGRIKYLCAHNGKEFDYPYLCRRMLINGLKIPEILNIAGKKPWETKHLDTMELWKFGDYKHYTSLNLLATILGIDTPKDDINGADVSKVYYEEQNLDRIVKYCQKDVTTTAQVLLKFKGMPKISTENITIVM